MRGGPGRNGEGRRFDAKLRKEGTTQQDLLIARFSFFCKIKLLTKLGTHTRRGEKNIQ